MTETIDDAQTVHENKRPKTLRDHLQAFLGALFIVIFTLIIIEIGLRVVDPWGLSYFDDVAYMGNEIFTAHPERGYILPDDRYQFSYWAATIENGQRVTPATHPDADCEIMILGDSMAHGFGVDDEETWVNVLAPAMPDTHLMNAAMPRYNSTNVLGTLRTFPDADAYFYLIFENDIEDAVSPETHTFVSGGNGVPMLIFYTSYAAYRITLAQQPNSSGARPAAQSATATLSETPQLRRFFDELDQIVADERVTIAAFRDYPLTNTIVQAGYDVQLVDYPPDVISYVDYHLNPVGNEALAAQTLPIFQQMRAEACDNPAG